MQEQTKQEYLGTGRRKTAVASVRVRDGSGKITVNGREFTEYFPTEIQRKLILAPVSKAQSNISICNLVITVRGGGIQAQAEAVRLGLARALVQENGELKHLMKEEGYLTRDSRKKERKKYGQKGARKRFQFSKR